MLYINIYLLLNMLYRYIVNEVLYLPRIQSYPEIPMDECTLLKHKVTQEEKSKVKNIM